MSIYGIIWNPKATPHSIGQNYMCHFAVIQSQLPIYTHISIEMMVHHFFLTVSSLWLLTYIIPHKYYPISILCFQRVAELWQPFLILKPPSVASSYDISELLIYRSVVHLLISDVWIKSLLVTIRIQVSCFVFVGHLCPISSDLFLAST